MITWLLEWVMVEGHAPVETAGACGSSAARARIRPQLRRNRAAARAILANRANITYESGWNCPEDAFSESKRITASGILFVPTTFSKFMQPLSAPAHEFRCLFSESRVKANGLVFYGA